MIEDVVLKNQDLQEKQERLKKKYTALALEHAKALQLLEKVNAQNYKLQQERDYLRQKTTDIIKKVGFEFNGEP